MLRDELPVEGSLRKNIVAEYLQSIARKEGRRFEGVSVCFVLEIRVKFVEKIEFWIKKVGHVKYQESTGDVAGWR